MMAIADTPFIPGSKWRVHDKTRPQPPIVQPGAAVGAPPSDAVVLFDGQDMAGWVSVKTGDPAAWKVEDGYMEVVRGTGNIKTAAHSATASSTSSSPARRGRRQRPGPRQQRRLPHGPLRGPGARQLRQPDLLRRDGRRDLRPVSAARQRLPQAGRVAGLRHRLHRPALGCRWQARLAGPADGVPKRRPGAARPRLAGPHGPQNSLELRHATWERRPTDVAGSPNPVRFRNIWVRRIVEEAA